jgi:hypothetical protein
MPESAADERGGSSGRIRTEEQPPRQTTRTHSILTASQLSTEFSSGCLGPVWTRKGTVEGQPGTRPATARLADHRGREREDRHRTALESHRPALRHRRARARRPKDDQASDERPGRRDGTVLRGAVPVAASRRQAAATRTIASRARRTGKMVADRADASITGCVHAEASARAPFCGEGLRSS